MAFTQEEIDNGILEFAKAEFPEFSNQQTQSNPFAEYEKERAAIFSAPEPEPKPDPLESRGMLGEIGTSIARGVFDVGEMGLRAMRLGQDKPGEDVGFIDKLATRGLNAMEEYRAESPTLQAKYTNGVKGAISGGVTAAVTSLTAGLPGMVAGAAAASFIPVVGTAMGAILGYALSAGGLFGVAQYDDVIQRADAQGISRDESESAAIWSGVHEAGWEFVSDLVGAKVLKITGKALTPVAKETLKQGISSLFKTGFKQTLKQMAKLSAVETGTEMLTAGFQTDIETGIGMGDKTFWEGAKAAFGPSFVASVIFGGIGAGGAKFRRGNIENSLVNPESDIRERLSAATQVKDTLKDIDPDIADVWFDNAIDTISAKEAIETDTDVTQTEPVDSISDTKRKIDNLLKFKKPTPEQVKRLKKHKKTLRELEKANIGQGNNPDSVPNYPNIEASRDQMMDNIGDIEAKRIQLADAEFDAEFERRKNPEDITKQVDETETLINTYKESDDYKTRAEAQRQIESLFSPGTSFNEGLAELENDIAVFRRLKSRDVSAQALEERQRRISDPSISTQELADAASMEDEKYWRQVESDIQGQQRTAKGKSQVTADLKSKKQSNQKFDSLQDKRDALDWSLDIAEQRRKAGEKPKHTEQGDANPTEPEKPKNRTQQSIEDIDRWQNRKIDIPKTDQSEYANLENDEAYWKETEQEIKTQKKVQDIKDKMSLLNQKHKLTEKDQVVLDRLEKNLRKIIPQATRATPQKINDQRIKIIEAMDAELKDIPESKGYWKDLQEKDSADFRGKLDIMQSEVMNSQTKGVNQDRYETTPYSSNSPQWMRDLPRDKNGKVYSRVQLNAVFDNLRSGKKLTPEQAVLADHIKTAMDKNPGESGEFIADDELADLEKKGFEVLGEQKIPITDMNEGDKFIGTVDGVKDEFEVKDTNADGETLLQGVVAKRVDMFDEVTVNGIKRAGKKTDIAEDLNKGNLVKSTKKPTPEVKGGKKTKPKKTETGTALYHKAQSPNKTITLSDAKQSFPGQSVFISPDGSISIRMKNGKGARITSVEHIDEDNVTFGMESGDMNYKGDILGKIVGTDITLKINGGGTFTLTHEIKHLLDNLQIITPTDNQALMVELRKGIKAGDLGFELSTLKDEKLARNEDLANMFAKIIEERKKWAGTRIGKLIQRVLDFVDGLHNIGKQSARKLAREFESGEIYSRKVNGKTVKTTSPAFETSAPQWYSVLEKGIESFKQNKAPGAQWLGMVKKMPGLKQEELEWVGLEGWLKEQKRPVLKQDILDFVRAHGVRVEEVVKAPVYEAQGTEGDTVYFDSMKEAEEFIEGEWDWVENESVSVETDENEESIYAMDHNGNALVEFYKEENEDGKTVWTNADEEGYQYTYDEAVANIEDAVEKEKNYWKENIYDPKLSEDGGVGFAEYQLPGGKNYKEILLTLPGIKEKFKSPHFDEPNIIAHVRMSERTVDGKKVLHIEEIQSDFLQDYRKSVNMISKAVENNFPEIVKSMETGNVLKEIC